MANQTTGFKKYSESINLSLQKSDFTCFNIYHKGHSSQNSNHTSWVRNNIPKFSKINSIDVGIDNLSFKNWGNDTGTAGAHLLTNWQVLYEDVHRYVKQLYDSDGNPSGTSNSTTDHQINNSKEFRSNQTFPYNYNKDVNSYCIISNSPYATPEDFSSETEDAGLLKNASTTIDKNKSSYEEQNTERLYFFFDQSWPYTVDITGNPFINYDITYPQIQILSNNSSYGTIKDLNNIETDNKYNIKNPSDVIRVQAVPKDSAQQKYRFVEWTGPKTKQKTAIMEFTQADLNANITSYTANFIPYYTVTIKNEYAGQCENDQESFDYDQYGRWDGTTGTAGLITLKNPTKTGYTFQGWTGEGITTPSKNVTIPVGSSGNKTYTAVWTVNEYPVSLEVYPTEAAADACYLDLYVTNTMSEPYGKGTTAKISFDKTIAQISVRNEADFKWVFERIDLYKVDEQTGAETLLEKGKNNVIMLNNIQMRAYPVKYKAVFKYKKFVIIPSASPGNSATFEFDGELDSNRPEELKVNGYDYGTKVTISVFPKYGYEFLGWNDGTTDSIKTFSITERLQPIANFKKVDLENKKTDLEISDSIIEKSVDNYSEKKVQGFGDYSFYNCKNLGFAEIAPDKSDDPTIPEFLPNVTIGQKALFGCEKMLSFKVPKTCISIGNGAFQNCKNLIALIIPTDTVLPFTQDPEGENSFLKGTNIQPDSSSNQYGRIYVPGRLIDEYKGKQNWERFADLFRSISEYPDICGE